MKVESTCFSTLCERMEMTDSQPLIFVRMIRLFTILSVISVMLSSCKKEDEDTTAPVIDVIAPENGLFIIMPDTIRIAASVRDESDLQGISVGLVDDLGNSFGSRKSINVTGNETSFDQTYEITDPRIPSGPYRIEFFATDGTNDEREFVEVQVAEVPKVFRGVLGNSESTNTLSFWRESDNSFSTIGQFPDEVLAEWLYILDLVLVVDKDDGDIQAIDPLDGTMQWTNSAALAGGTVEVTRIHVDQFSERLFCSTDQEQVVSFNAQGARSITYHLEPGEMVQSFYTDDNYLWCGVVDGNGTGRMLRYFLVSGFRDSNAWLGEIPSFLDVHQEEMYIVAAQGDALIIYELDTDLRSPVSLPANDGLFGVAYGDGFIHTLSEDQVFVTDPQSLQTVIRDIQSGARGIFFDEIGGRLVISYPDGIRFYSPNTVSLIGTLSWPQVLSKSSPVYNK